MYITIMDAANLIFRLIIVVVLRKVNFTIYKGSDESIVSLKMKGGTSLAQADTEYFVHKNRKTCKAYASSIISINYSHASYFNINFYI